MLGTQDVMMKVGYPLAAGDRHVQIFDAILDVRGNAVPEKPPLGRQDATMLRRNWKAKDAVR
jgi:hypothetical protein